MSYDGIGPSKNAMIAMAEKAAKTQARISKAKGAPGTVISGGEIEGIEHNTNLQREKWLGETGDVGIVQKMRLTNPQVQAMMLAVKLPILGGEWNIREADYANVDGLEKSGAEEHASTVRRGFFETPVDDWRHTLSEALLHLDYGFFLFEKEWEVQDDGTYGIRKFGPRLPQTVIRWLTKKNEFAGVEQRYYDSDSSQFIEAELKAESLILLTHAREGNNFAGVSLLRPIWAICQIKEMLLKLLSIAFEREALGIPIATMPEGGASADQIDDVEKLLENIRAHQKQYGILPFDFKLEWVFNGGSSGSWKAILDALRYLDEQTLNSSLTQFIGLGSTASGSRGVAKEHTDLFWMVLNGIAASLSSAFSGVGRGPTSGVIRQLVFLNHGEQAAYPYLEAGGIEGNNLSDFSDGLQKMGKYLTPDDVMEEFIRAKFGVPLRPPEEVDANPKSAQIEREAAAKAAAVPPQPGSEDPKDGDDKDPANGKAPKGDDDKDPIKARDVVLAETGAFAFVPPRELTSLEQSVRFAEMALRFDTAPEDATAEVIGEIKAAIEKILPRLNRAIKKGAVASIPKKLPGLEAAIKAVLDRHVEETITFGEATVRGEARRQALTPVTAAPVRRFAEEPPPGFEYDEHLTLRRTALDGTVDAVAAETAAAALARVKTEAIGAIRHRLPGISVSRATIGSIGVRRSSVGLTATALNLGRDQAAAALNVQQVQFSAVMDQRTCSECAPADGRTFPFGSVEHTAHECPFATCEGGGLCRCILVYLFSGDKR